MDFLKQITGIEFILDIVIAIGVIGIVVVFFFMIFFITKRNTNKKTFQERALDRLSESKSEHFNLDSIETRLSKMGANFMFNNKISPLTYIVVKFFLAFLFFIILLLTFGFVLGIVGAIFGFFAFDILLKVSNDRDNELMMTDIKLFCSVLNVQTLSGTSVLSALAESYAVVKHPRLKAALTELSSKIFAHQDFDDAVDEFKAQFQNKYIDSCCTILKQSQDSGKSGKLLKDLSNQISDIQTAIHVKEKSIEEVKNAFLSIFIFGGFMAIVLYALLSQVDLSAIF